MELKELNTRISPGDWRVLEAMGKKFVATQAYEGHPYHKRTRFVDIAGDEDYDRKDADMELIALAPNLLRHNIALREALQKLPLENFSDDMGNHDAAEFVDHAGEFFEAMLAVKKALAEQ